MKKFNVYSNGTLILTETEDELLKNISDKVKEEVIKLKVGDTYHHTNVYSYDRKINSRGWEFERVV